MSSQMRPKSSLSIDSKLRLPEYGPEVAAPAAVLWLAPARAMFPRRSAIITRPGGWRRQEIPIRAFTEWDDARPAWQGRSGRPTVAAAPRASTSARSAQDPGVGGRRPWNKNDSAHVEEKNGAVVRQTLAALTHAALQAPNPLPPS